VERRRPPCPRLAVAAFALVVLLPPSLATAGPAGSPPTGPGPWMVRAWFGDQAMIREVAAWAGHIGVYPEKGFILVQVDAEELGRLAAAGFYVEVDAERTALLHRFEQSWPAGAGIPGFPCYRTVEETLATGAALAAAHPQLASWVDVGDSWEKTQNPDQGYDLRVLELTNSAVAGPKPVFFVTAAIHAREYTTAELATRFAERLLAEYDHDPDVTWLLDYQRIDLLLETNPDGRKRAEAGLSWRKNADDDYCTGTNSRGADLNRNFDFQWACCGGSSGSPCSETYHGAAGGSEPETQAVAGHMAAVFPVQRPPDLTTPAPDDSTGVYIDLHSYGGDVLTPWTFSPTPPPNAAGILRLGRKYGYFPHYEAHLGGLYTADGTTKDYAYGRFGVPGYTVEVGTAFFEDCSLFENVILPDNLPALLYAAKAARTPYLTPAGPDAVDPALPPQAFAAGDPVPVTATLDDTRYTTLGGSEPTQAIAAGEVTVDEPPWAAATPVPMAAVDGLFDETVEAASATLDTSSLAPGRHTVFVRGQDADGNWGAVSARFLHVIDPGVAPTLAGFLRDADTLAPLGGTVRAGDFETASNPATGHYSLQVPAGTYDLTASAPGHAPVTAAGVVADDFQTVQHNFALPPWITLLADDVEGGNVGWTAQSPWAITAEASFSPTHSWTDSPGGNYANNANKSLTAPPLDCTGLAGVRLSFRQIYDLEAGFDFGRVEVSTDGGGSWSPVTLYTGTHTGSWEAVELPLPMLDGVAAGRVRFRLTSDGGVTRDGWHLDDLVVEGHSPVAASLVFADGFESGDLAAWSAAVP
jgi:carboxypeptidase T